ncbi:MAG: RNA-binding domain-containing protein [Candidatus Thorarchaeota archaeon]|jgi:predicted RNA binding protein with dsRBD fold (UPF0201 family)
MKIVVRAPVYPTEDQSRISEALSHPFPDVIFERIQEGEIAWLQYEADNRTLLDTLREMIHENRIIDASRRILESSWTGTNSSMHIDKQAAYRNKLRLIDQDDEPPLGTINIIVKMNDDTQLEEFLKWFTPPTKDGRIVRD